LIKKFSKKGSSSCKGRSNTKNWGSQNKIG